MLHAALANSLTSVPLPRNATKQNRFGLFFACLYSKIAILRIVARIVALRLHCGPAADHAMLVIRPALSSTLYRLYNPIKGNSADC